MREEVIQKAVIREAGIREEGIREEGIREEMTHLLRDDGDGRFLESREFTPTWCCV